MAETPIIIRRVQSDDHDDHHGGGWKIAYADFMTAMMAFFLLMWLVGAADEEQRKGLADYFTPSLSEAGGRGQGVLSGQVPAQDGILAGGSEATEDRGAASFGHRNSRERLSGAAGEHMEMVEAETPSPDEAQTAAPAGTGDAAAPDAADPDAAADARQAERAAALRGAIETAVAETPELAGFERHLRFESLPEGLYVQIVDDARRSMFEVGSAELRGRPLALVRKLGSAFARTNHPIVITGHTDALPFRADAGYTNWELSTDRAHATRRELVALGIDPARVQRISGMADTRPLDATRPKAPQNRRIGILIKTVDAPAAYPERTLAHLTLP